MRAYLIDPFEKKITEVEHNGDYRQIYELIQAGTFTCVGIGHDRDTIYLDDEGLYVEDQRYFKLEGYDQPLAGRGLVLGTDYDGEAISPQISFDQLRRLITWPPSSLELQGFVYSEGTMDHPLAGPDTQFISNKPVFGFRKDKG